MEDSNRNMPQPSYIVSDQPPRAIFLLGIRSVGEPVGSSAEQMTTTYSLRASVVRVSFT